MDDHKIRLIKVYISPRYNEDRKEASPYYILRDTAIFRLKNTILSYQKSFFFRGKYIVRVEGPKVEIKRFRKYLKEIGFWNIKIC